jgi:Holliday junction resolvase RusA-like endonuclease
MNELRLTIPGNPPTGNHYKKPNTRGGYLHWYLTAEAKAWYATVAALAAGRKVSGSRLMLDYRVYVPTRRRGDLDNYLKCLQDSLVLAGVIEDDNLIVELRGIKVYDKGNARTEIALTEVA